jgi:integrase
MKVVRRANDVGADLPALSPHALRRSFASWLIAEGEDVSYVQDQLGHRDPTMTLGVYARAVPARRAAVRTPNGH